MQRKEQNPVSQNMQHPHFVDKCPAYGTALGFFAYYPAISKYN